MKIGPKGERRPTDPIAQAVMIGRIATGEAEESHVKRNASEGGKARARTLTAERRSEIARNGAKARWNK